VNLERFIERAEILHNRLADLYQTATVLPWIPYDLLPEAFKELYTTSKMVQLAVEELQEQNEELLQTRNLLETQRQHYQYLFEFAPTAYLLSNPQGIIQESNRAAAELLNISQNFLVGKPIINFISQQQHQNFYKQLIQISKSEQEQEIFATIKPRHQQKFNASLKVKVIHHQHDKTPTLYWSINKINPDRSQELAYLKKPTELLSERPIHKYSRGEIIPLHPLSIWYINQGLVKLSTFCEAGAEILTGLATPEMVFGSGITSLSIYQAVALSDVELVLIYLQELEFFPDLKHILLPKIQQRLQQVESFLYLAGKRKVKDRFFHLLEILKQQMGEPVPQGTRLIFRLTHEDIANACGTTRVTITRLIGEFQEQGIITFDSKKHIILTSNNPSC
jgi:PAS domain S-box-containing protein